MQNRSNRLSLTDAVNLAGPILFGADWIIGLDKKHRDALGKYGPKPYGVANPVIVRPCPPKFRVALDRAIGKDIRMMAQRRSALDWILAAKVMTDANHCDQTALTNALKGARSKKNPVGAPAVVRERVAREMREAIQAGTLSKDDLRKLKEEALPGIFSGKRKACAEAKKVVLAELATISK